MQAARILNYRFPFQLAPVAGTLCDPNWKRISISMFSLQSSGYSQKHGCWGAWCGFLISPHFPEQAQSDRWERQLPSWTSQTVCLPRELELSRHKLVVMGKLSVKGALATKTKDWLPRAPHPHPYRLRAENIFSYYWHPLKIMFYLFYFFGIEPNGLEKGEEIQLISILALFKGTQ